MARLQECKNIHRHPQPSPPTIKNVTGAEATFSHSHEIVRISGSYGVRNYAAGALYRARLRRWEVTREVPQTGPAATIPASRGANDPQGPQTEDLQAKAPYEIAGYLIGELAIVPGVAVARSAVSEGTILNLTTVLVLVRGCGGRAAGGCDGVKSESAIGKARFRPRTVLWAHAVTSGLEDIEMAIMRRRHENLVHVRPSANR